MADRHLFVWQQRLSIAVAAVGLGLMTGCSLPIARSVNQKTMLPLALSVPKQNLDPNTSRGKALTIHSDEGYEKAIARLAEAEKVKLLNFPVPVQFQGKTIRDVKLNSQNKAIALTFDDGPWPNMTSQVLDVLKKNMVKATFFVVGKQVEKYPQLVKQVVADGHALGNHTWSHEYHLYSEAAAARELDNTAKLLYKITGVKTTLFRPPAGVLNNGLAAYAHEKNQTVVMWSVDSRDWRYYRSSTAQTLLESVLKEAKPGGIVLLHDGGGDRSTTIQALPQIIAQLRKRGYKLVTVPELLEIGDKKLRESKASKG